MPLVAIVTPVYNGEKFLAETMDCIQEQDYPHLVHVIMDNASSDTTPQIIDRFRGKRVPLITARRTETAAMAANWNAAVSMTPPNAGYFRIVCADDVLRPDAITRQIEIAERHPDVSIVGCLWRADGLCGEELPADRTVFEGKEVLRGYLRREHTALSGMHVLVRRGEICSSLPFYDETLASFDTEANMRLCTRSRFGFVRAELGAWRRHAESVTSRIASRTFAHEMCWLTVLDRYGHWALGFREYLECRRAYRQHLLRRLLKTRMLDRDVDVFSACLEQFRLAGDPVSATDFPRAMLDWAMLAVQNKRRLVGMPRHVKRYGGARVPVRVPQF